MHSDHERRYGFPVSRATVVVLCFAFAGLFAGAGPGTSGGMMLKDHGSIKVSGGCEVYTEGRLQLEVHGNAVKVILKNKSPYGYFLSPDGNDLNDFKVLVDRETMAGFFTDLKSKLDNPRPNDHPSTRDARVEIRLPLESCTIRQELDELRGDRDVDPALEVIDSFVQSCAAAYRETRAPFLDAYEDPVVDETTPPPEFWVPGLRRFEVYEKKKEHVRSRPDGRTVSDTWIVTKSGRRFPPRDIQAALKEIGCRPTREEEAVRTAAVMLRHLNAPHSVHVLDKAVPVEGYTTERVPPEIRKKIAPPAVTKKKEIYEVVLYGYVQAMSGFPEEWLKRWCVRIGPGVYEAEEEETLWTERGAYKW